MFDWLRQNIWQHGSRFTTSQLIRRATGEDLNSRYSPRAPDHSLPRIITRRATWRVLSFLPCTFGLTRRYSNTHGKPEKTSI
ncbi:hypothetical protein LNQ52_26005 [Klebsiella pneumoniae subsp. pneumoniae]|nr:hypothetical protein [Klebsiella pneumoniae subsp. pneumoniae]